MSFSTLIPVRFGDVDLAGFVYYPRIFHYLHVAMEEFFAECCGTPYASVMADERLGFPVVHVETEFSQSLFYGDEALVEVTVSKVGNSSVTFEYSVLRATDSTLCVRSTQTHVAMNLDARRGVSLPDKYRDAFARHKTRQTS